MTVRGVGIGIAITGALVLFGVLFYFQTKDPMVMLFAVQASFVGWLVIFILDVLRRGIPIRIVEDERKKRE